MAAPTLPLHAQQWNNNRTHAATPEYEREVRNEVHRRLGLDTDNPVDVVNNPNILEGMDLSAMSADGMKTVVNKICAALDITRRRPMSSNSSNMYGGEQGWRGACTRRGNPSPIAGGGMRKGNKAPSERCGCKFRFVLFADGRIIIHNHSAETEHHLLCQPRILPKATALCL
jgi:hypothetical protein